ncbi:hypothetical protein [Glutamicibacter sp.]|uniref:hypothetical protein n=1 Tax=Glutamicibacter sp. TaxID=1931995 RepID=UPI0028BD2E44|nr:hypothetical protein [Glutamicibacter sp.]
MSTSLYYTATRATPLSDAEHRQLMSIARAHNDAFEFDYETLYFYPAQQPDEVLNGSTKISMEPAEMAPSLLHWLAALTELRQSLPDAHWEVSLDEVDIHWDEARGYSLPGLEDMAAMYDEF